MKYFTMLGFLCLTLFSCSTDDDTANEVNKYKDAEGEISLNYNGEKITFDDLSFVVVPGRGPEYDIEIIGINTYEDVHMTRYSVKLELKLVNSRYTVQQIDFGISERIGDRSIVMHGYYAMTIGEIITPGFSSDLQITEEGNLTGTFSGTLYNMSGETIDVNQGTVKAQPNSESFLPAN
ncbi:hypothetical protein [Flavobacterium psychrotrophum]|uniref:hypothetical protein n=1 Tax=Flavobacterium psychrotrophum TaxID=2294119 RepID=UPI000E3224E1|nr:hypothetical protein [Flavobacterium psychrotrophum]